jgi:hypothetical protein
MLWYHYKLVSSLALFVFLPHWSGQNHWKVTNSDFVVVVNDASPGAAIPDDFLGFSYETGALTDTLIFGYDHIKYLNLLNNLGKGVIRINGFYANWVGWVKHPRTPALIQTSKFYKTDTIATSDLDSMFTFIRRSNFKVIIGINTYTSTPAIALSEISYAWSKAKDVIQAFELGNEPDGLYKADYDLYRRTIIPYYTLIKSRIPSAPLIGPASVHPEHFGLQFIQQDADKAVFATIHEYPVGETGVPDNVYQLLDNKYIQKGHAQSHMIDTCSQRHNIRYRIAECNNFGNEGIDVSDRFAAALWGVDFMMDAASANALGVNFHGGGRGFTPILIKKGQLPIAQSLYYGMLFFHQASKGRILPVNMTPIGLSFKAYATLTSENTVLVTLINKSTDSDVFVSLSCKSNYTKASLIRLTAPSIYSKDSIQLAGSTVDSGGSWKPAKSEIAPLSGGMVKLTVPKSSALLLTFKK